MPVLGSNWRSLLRLDDHRLQANHDHPGASASAVLWRLRLLVDSCGERLEADAQRMQSIRLNLSLRKAVI